jgi:hypothetical protein
MFLSEEEIREMTQRIKRSAQAKMLRSLGIVFKIRADGSLLVLRSHVEKEMGDAPAGKAKQKDYQPNWSGIHA